MLAFAYGLNILILVPLLLSLYRDTAGMADAFGPDSDARRILACLYATIALVSVYALVQLALDNRSVAIQIAWVLFPVQIIYKLATVPTVGLGSPVVMTNLFVVVVLIATLAALRY